ncbi:MAG: hypothetical protein ACW991_03785 [Candidatus Hodarchaeales archaeon]|jgi:hypothetical protein
MLGQTGNCQNIDNVNGRTINLHHEVTIHLFSLGGGWGALDSTLYYFAISVFSTQVHWNETITLTG